MNTFWRWGLALSFAAGGLTCATFAQQTAVVTADRVNVRGQAKLASEVITQLREGETVTVIEEITLSQAAAGEPVKWAKIRVPSDTTVWVFAPFIDPDTGAVNVNRLNMRAGAGEQYSVLGRVERGTPVREIRVQNNWMEIEPPESAYAYVAAQFLQITGEPAPTTELAATPPAETAPTTPAETGVATAEPATPGEAVPVEPVAESTALAAAADTETPATTPATTAAEPGVDAEVETMEDVEPPRRVVAREGFVVVARSIQAPTGWVLESPETHRLINYLHTENLGINLKNFGGRKVIVTGEELLDKRWRKTPILDVESIQLVP